MFGGGYSNLNKKKDSVYVKKKKEKDKEKEKEGHLVKCEGGRP
jgi:hypothetical protein